jgi:hypothetical protein
MRRASLGANLEDTNTGRSVANDDVVVIQESYAVRLP